MCCVQLLIKSHKRFRATEMHSSTNRIMIYVYGSLGHISSYFTTPLNERLLWFQFWRSRCMRYSLRECFSWWLRRRCMLWGSPSNEGCFWLASVTARLQKSRSRNKRPGIPYRRCWCVWCPWWRWWWGRTRTDSWTWSPSAYPNTTCREHRDHEQSRLNMFLFFERILLQFFSAAYTHLQNFASFFQNFTHIYIYAFSRRFYPERLTLHSSYSFTFDQLMLSLGIEPMILALLAPCSTIWATGKLYSLYTQIQELHTKCKMPHISCKMKHCIQNITKHISKANTFAIILIPVRS